MSSQKNKFQNLFHQAKGQIILLASVISVAIFGDTAGYEIGGGIEVLIFFFFILFSAIYTANLAKEKVFSSKAIQREIAFEYGIKTAGGLSAFYVLIYFDQEYYEKLTWVAIDSLLVAVPIACFCSILFGQISTVTND